jgi:hydrogenase maturation protease
MQSLKSCDMASRRPALLVGLGNSIRCDDAVGIAVARHVHARLQKHEVQLHELSAGGLELMEALAGYAHAVIVDAIVGGEQGLGACYRLEWQKGQSSQRTGGLHELGLLEGLELARRIGLRMPDVLRIYVVEVREAFVFGTSMSAAVQAAVVPAANLILAQEYGVIAEAQV